MSNRKSVNTLILMALTFSLPAHSMDTDDGLHRKRILGTWHSEFEWHDQRHPDSWIKAQGRDVYRDDGSLSGRVEYEYPDRAATSDYEARWVIENAELIVEIIKSEGGYLKPGTTTRDKILSLSDDELVLESEDGKRIVLHKLE